MIGLLNPTSARWGHRFPLSIMHVGAVLEGKYPYEIFDQNLEPNVSARIERMAATGQLKYLAITVMPGPQLMKAIPFSKTMKERFPGVSIIWGGYFPTLHTRTVLQSGYVDYVVAGAGEQAFLELVDILEGNSRAELAGVRGLAYIASAQIMVNPQREATDPNLWAPLPYHKIDPPRYLNRTYLGARTAGYYSSVGCPFLCGFCAIASINQGRWKPRASEAIVQDLLALRAKYGVDAVEFFDENFFTRQQRTHEFSEMMVGKGITWWGEGRPDTVLAYSDDTLHAMRRGGCKMIFFGAESSSQEILDRMNKGGTQTPDTVIRLAERLKRFDIVPEFSFVLGSPGDDVDADIDRDIAFIRRVKSINPRAEIILYTYAPVVFEDSELFSIGRRYGFRFPESLEEWMDQRWQKFDLRKSPVIPWLKPRHYRKIRNFEWVLNGYYPTISDIKLKKLRRLLLRAVTAWRYLTATYWFPLEIRSLLHVFRYRQPEIEGF